MQRRLAQGLSWEKYLEAKGKSEDKVREELRETAPGPVKTKLVMDALAEKEGLMPTADEVTVAVYRMGINLVNDEDQLHKLISDPDAPRGNQDASRDEGHGVPGRSCDADPESARCDECAAEDEHEDEVEAPKADEPRAHDSEGEAQE